MLRILLISVAIAGVVAGNSSAQTSAFRHAAQQLTNALEERSQCGSLASFQVGLWPFDAREMPISQGGADRIYRQLLDEMLLIRPVCVDYIDANGLGVTREILTALTSGSPGENGFGAIQNRLRDVRYFLSGTIMAQGDETSAYFRLDDHQTGATIATAGPISIPEGIVGTSCGDNAAPLDTVARRIALRFREGANDMQRMVVDGGYFENSDARTEFSQFFEAALVSNISDVYGNMITDRAVGIEYLYSRDEASAYRLLQLRGLTVSERQVQEELIASPALQGEPHELDGAYLLRYRYWPCDDAIRINASLTNAENETVSWIGSIQRNDIPEGLDIEPPTPTQTRDWGPDGAFAFQMTSQRGGSPTYRPGEAMEVLFRLSRDAWLYCFYTDSSGQVMQVLPNQFQIDQAAAHFYQGGRLHQFPDGNRLPVPDPFELTINAETYGIEVFRCFATSRDITGELPASMRGTTFDPLPQSDATRLREIFEAIEGASISTASMTITVLPEIGGH